MKVTNFNSEINNKLNMKINFNSKISCTNKEWTMEIEIKANRIFKIPQTIQILIQFTTISLMMTKDRVILSLTTIKTRCLISRHMEIITSTIQIKGYKCRHSRIQCSSNSHNKKIMMKILVF